MCGRVFVATETDHTLFGTKSSFFFHEILEILVTLIFIVGVATRSFLCAERFGRLNYSRASGIPNSDPSPQAVHVCRVAPSDRSLLLLFSLLLSSAIRFFGAYGSRVREVESDQIILPRGLKGTYDSRYYRWEPRGFIFFYFVFVWLF